MLFRAAVISPVLLLAACSFPHSDSAKTEKSLTNYARNNSKIISINPTPTTGNQCVDNFNFLRQAGHDKYQDYSQKYIAVGNGYTFLNKNKNIMDKNAQQVYSMNLDMKLDTLCSKVNYAGYQLIRSKIKELYGN